MAVEIIKAVGAFIISPIIFLYVSLKIAKFHFEKDMRKQYLIAKDKTANEMLTSMTEMLLAMWDVYNATKMDTDDKRIKDLSCENARGRFWFHLRQTYLQLARMGLYHGTEIVEDIAKLQDEWSDKINNNDFKFLDTWEEYRVNTVFLLLEKLHTELKDTVFGKKPL
ncbi:MAG TPA: hypothetical protein DCW97_07195 [Acidobacteria bacterium]|nr:hypothetical protein [Acidobacteriota bacterium]